MKTRVSLSISALAVMYVVNATAAEKSDETPSLELLEFLGSFDTKDGEDVDPMMLLTIKSDEKGNSKQEEQNYD